MRVNFRAAIGLAWLLASAATIASAERPGWQEERPLGQAPSPREYAAGVYDPTRDRLVVFGGYDYGPARDDTWTLLLNGRPKWVELDTLHKPAGLWDQAAVYDPARDRVLVFGGIAMDDDEQGVHDANQTWALGFGPGESWDRLSIDGDLPTPRDGHTAVLDPVRGNMIVFGGGGAGGLLADAWALSLTGPEAWSQVQAAGDPPAPRGRHSAIYDPLHERMVVFGGATQDGELLNDLWSLSLDGSPTWTRLSPEGDGPSARAGHRAVYDPIRHRMIVFGGYQGDSQPLASDLWELTLDGAPEWRALPLDGPAPEAGFTPLLILDEQDGHLVLLGSVGSTTSHQVWSLPLEEESGAVQRAFTISPNPAPARASTFGFYLPAAGAVEMQVVDVAGRKVWGEVLGDLGSGWHSLSMGSGLAPGVYWVKVRLGGEAMVGRLVVVR